MTKSVVACGNWLQRNLQYKKGDYLALVATILQIAMIWCARYHGVSFSMTGSIQIVVNVLLLRSLPLTWFYVAGSIYISLISLHGIYLIYTTLP